LPDLQSLSTSSLCLVFLGTAIVTSLPELVTTVAAVRRGALQLAVLLIALWGGGAGLQIALG